MSGEARISLSKVKEGLSSLRDVCRLIWAEADRFVRWRLLEALLLITTASALTTLGPVALKLIVDGFSGRTGVLSQSTVLLVVLYVSSQWLSRTVGEIRGFIYARAERRMMRTLSQRLFGLLMYLPLRFHMERQTGALNQVLNNGLQGMQLVNHTLVFTILPVFTELATIVLVLSRVGKPEFLGLFCFAIGAYAVIFTYAAASIKGVARSATTAQVEANAVMTDAILNYETVKYFTAEDAIQDRVGRALTATETGWVRFYQRYAYNGLYVGTVFAMFLAVTILYAAREVAAGRMTVGTFILVNSYMLQIVRPVEMLGYAMQSLSQGVAYLEKLMELLREKPEPRHPASTAAVKGPGRLDFENVGVAYRSDRSVLKDISFKLRPGQTLGVVGGSGAGKSTLVRLIVRLLEPDQGRLLLDGVPLSDLSLSELRRSIAVVPQDTVLFNDTIGYNIAFGKNGSTQEEIVRAAKVAHLHSFIERLPEGYDTKVGERGVKLSGGEKQRVSIARAAIKQPKIYIFDEATSSLDSQTEREILANLREISRTSTTIVIAHRLSTVIHADEIVVLEGGTIAERGTHASLLHLNQSYARLWLAQQQGAAAA